MAELDKCLVMLVWRPDMRRVVGEAGITFIASTDFGRVEAARSESR